MKYTEFITINNRKFYAFNHRVNQFAAIKLIAKDKKIRQETLCATLLYLRTNPDKTVDVFLKRPRGGRVDTVLAVLKTKLLDEWEGKA